MESGRVLSKVSSAVLLTSLLTASLSAQVEVPIATTIAAIESQLAREEAVLAPARIPAPWDVASSGSSERPRLISNQFPTTFGDLFEVRAPAGDRFLTLVENDLAIRTAGGDTTRRLTNDGTNDRSWRATEESSQDFPASWSPDGTRIAAVRLDVGQVHHEALLRTLNTPPTIDFVTYARAGEPMPRFDLFVIDVASGARIALQLGDTSNHYVNILGWRGDGRAVYVQLIDREHKRLRILSVDAASGLPTTLIEETTSTYFDTPMTDGPRTVLPLVRSDGFLYLSERSGWRNIYRYRRGRPLEALAGGARPVHEIVDVDETRGWIYFTASPDQRRPYDVALFRTRLAGGKPVMLDGGRGNLTVRIKPGDDEMMTVRSDVAHPPVVTFRRSDGRAVRQLRPLTPAALAAVGVAGMEPFEAPSTDGKWTMQGVILKPHGFDAAKSYPVVEVAYGGMQWDIVPKDYYGFGVTESGYNGLIARVLAAHGYVVVLVSAPGTPGRGRQFQDATYGRWPQGVVPNHIQWIKAAAATRPWMDLGRVGIYGNSWGGYMAERAMIEAPNFYAAAVAMSPPSDLVDHPTYIEPFMGLPAHNPEGYAAASNLRRIDAIKGPILVMPEPLDVNAGFSPGMKFVDAMVRARKDVALFSFPDVNHRVNCCGRAIEYYAYAVVERFFDRTLKPLAATGGTH